MSHKYLEDKHRVLVQKSNSQQTADRYHKKVTDSKRKLPGRNKQQTKKADPETRPSSGLLGNWKGLPETGSKEQSTSMFLMQALNVLRQKV
jgi:hypothetical protein